MSYLVISEGKTYKIAHLIETFKTHQQIEIIPEHTKRKIKPEQAIYKLKTNDIKNFLSNLNQLTSTIDTELLWDMIEDENKKTIHELATLYFGEHCTETETTALLFALSNKSIEFENYNDATFSKCNKIEQTKRKAIQDKQLKEQQLFDTYYSNLINFENPNFPDNLNSIKLIHKPDKHSIEYKALTQASKYLNISILELAHQSGIITNVPNFFIDTFLLDNFAKGLSYNYKNIPKINYTIKPNLELNVFSIDDKTTTEIDDAFSIICSNDQYIIGIHISAPALDNTLEDMVADNISTVYYPSSKITMLPEEIIQQYSLYEDKILPVTSIYFVLDLEFNILEYYSKLEQVKVRKNLRIEELETLFNHENLEQNHNYPYENELKILHKFANKLEDSRGKPSVNNLSVDYNFSFEGDNIIITPRIRGNPIDKLVSELMILANCTWGRMLTNSFIPAIYRVKQPNFPVKMTTQADSHTGLNVSYYTWATSPLRRSADYVNQHQIISMINKTKDYYTSTSPILTQVVEDFDKKYSKYIDFQNKMERYWSLAYLKQQNISELDGIFIYKSKIQLSGVPIEIDTTGLINPKPKGSIIKIKILKINLTTLQLDFKITE